MSKEGIKTKNTGKEYETFVARIQQALLDADTYTKTKTIKVETNKKIIDTNECEREFDVYWEYELGGIVYKTIIECKDHDTSISIDKIDALIGKTRDIPGLIPIFATRKDYQSGAKQKARVHNIELLIIREQNDSDWISPDGTPYIQEIGITMELYRPARISSFTIEFDGKWILENTSIDDTQRLCELSEGHDKIIIQDIKKGEEYFLLDLSSKLLPIGDSKFGSFEKVEVFEDAYIVGLDSYPDKLKIKSYKVSYTIFPPIRQSILKDFTKELLGVIEYINRREKRTILKDGVIRKEKLS